MISSYVSNCRAWCILILQFGVGTRILGSVKKKLLLILLIPTLVLTDFRIYLSSDVGDVLGTSCKCKFQYELYFIKLNAFYMGKLHPQEDLSEIFIDWLT